MSNVNPIFQQLLNDFGMEVSAVDKQLKTSTNIQHVLNCILIAENLKSELRKTNG